MNYILIQLFKTEHIMLVPLPGESSPSTHWSQFRCHDPIPRLRSGAFSGYHHLPLLVTVLARSNTNTALIVPRKGTCSMV